LHLLLLLLQEGCRRCEASSSKHSGSTACDAARDAASHAASHATNDATSNVANDDATTTGCPYSH